MKNYLKNIVSSVKHSNVLGKIDSLVSAKPFASSSRDDLFNNQKYSDTFKPEHELVFERRVYRLIKTKNSFLYLKLLVFPVKMYFAYKSLRSIVFFRPMRTIFWAACLGATFYLEENNKKKENYVLEDINLLENGKEVNIKYNSFYETVPINQIRRLTEEESKYYDSLVPFTGRDYLPLVIRNKFYVISKRSDILDPEVLAAVSQGKSIDTTNRINYENTLNTNL